MESKEVHTTFELGDIVAIYDTYNDKLFVAHCVEKKEELSPDCKIKTTFNFAVDSDEDHNLSYVVGEDRSNNMYEFRKIIGNIKTSSYVPIY